MATSRFEAAREALSTAIVTRLTTDSVAGVSVHKYRPPTLDREAVVWIGDISGEQEPYTQGPDGTRLEEMEIDVQVRCPTHGSSTDEFETVEQKAEAVMASIENLCRLNPTLSAALFNVEFAAFETNHTYDDEGAVGVVEITITAEAHL